MTPQIGFYIASVVVLTILRALVPFLENPQRVFRVNIPADQTKDTELVNNKFAYGISIALVSIVMISYIIRGNPVGGYIYPAMCILMICADGLVYFVYHNKIKTLSENKGWDKNSIKREEKLNMSKYTIPVMALFIATILIVTVIGFR